MESRGHKCHGRYIGLDPMMIWRQIIKTFAGSPCTGSNRTYTLCYGWGKDATLGLQHTICVYIWDAEKEFSHKESIKGKIIIIIILT